MAVGGISKRITSFCRYVGRTLAGRPGDEGHSGLHDICCGNRIGHCGRTAIIGAILISEMIVKAIHDPTLQRLVATAGSIGPIIPQAFRL